MQSAAIAEIAHEIRALDGKKDANAALRSKTSLSRRAIVGGCTVL
jgi:hypothetical protein